MPFNFKKAGMLAIALLVLMSPIIASNAPLHTPLFSFLSGEEGSFAWVSPVGSGLLAFACASSCTPGIDCPGDFGVPVAPIGSGGGGGGGAGGGTCPPGYALNGSGTQCIPSGSGGGAGGICANNQGQSCTASNSCGMSNSGTITCGGYCNVSAPPDTSCLPPTISMNANPSLVNRGESCTVSWSAQNTTSCTLSSNGFDPTLPQSVGASGSYTSPALTTQRIYTLNCRNGSAAQTEASVTCRLNPVFQEK